MNNDKPSLSNNLIGKFSKHYFTAIVNAGISFVAILVTTRLFSKDIYGFLNLFNTTAIVITSIVTIGMDSAYIRFFFEPINQENHRELATKCIMPAMPFIFFTYMALIFSPSILRRIFGEASWYIASMVTLYVLAQVALRFLNLNYRMLERTGAYMVQSILVQFFMKLFVVVAAILNPTKESVVFFNTISIFLLAMVYFFVQKNSVFKVVKLNYKGYRPVFLYALATLPLYVIHNANTFVSQFFIRSSLGYNELGIYASVNLFVTIVLVLKNGFNTYWSGFVFKNYQTHQKQIEKMHDYIVLLSIFGMIVLVAMQDILYLLIGPNFQSGKPLLGTMVLSAVVLLIMETTSYGIMIAKKMHLAIAGYVAFILTNSIICYRVLPVIGIAGGALASAASSLVLFIVNTIIAQKYYRTVRNIKRTVCGVILAIITAVASLRLHAYRQIVFVILFGILACSIVLYWQVIKEIFHYAKTFLKKGKT